MENSKDAGISPGTQDAWRADADVAGTQTQDAISNTGENYRSTDTRFSSASNRSYDRFSEKANQARAMLSEKFDQMKNQQGKWADVTRDRVRQNPMLAVGIAMAAGLLLRRVLFRSR